LEKSVKSDVFKYIPSAFNFLGNEIYLAANNSKTTIKNTNMSEVYCMQEIPHMD